MSTNSFFLLSSFLFGACVYVGETMDDRIASDDKPH